MHLENSHSVARACVGTAGAMSGLQPGLTAAGVAAAGKPRIKATVRLQHMKFMQKALAKTQAIVAVAALEQVCSRS